MVATARGERFGLRIGPTVTGMATSAGPCAPFEGNQPSTAADEAEAAAPPPVSGARPAPPPSKGVPGGDDEKD